MPARPPLVARRTALSGAVLGLGAVAGCDLDPTGDQGPTGDAGSSGDPDPGLVAQAVSEIGAVRALVRAAATELPRLTGMTATLQRLHSSHLNVLGEPEPASTFDGRLAGPAQALGTLRTRERRLQGRLADLAVAAESGTLARLLASMSAAVAQALVELPTTLPETGRAS